MTLENDARACRDFVDIKECLIKLAEKIDEIDDMDERVTVLEERQNEI